MSSAGTGNGWVTVGKVKNMKSKKREAKENKKQTKQPAEIVPQYPPEFIDFLEGEKPIIKRSVDIKPEKKEILDKVVNGGSPKKAAKKKSAKEPRDNVRMTSSPQFEKDVKKLSLEDLISMLDTTKAHFPGNKLIWLKDVAAYLNHCLPYEVADSIFEGKSIDYPKSLLPKGVVDLLENLLDDCPDPTLQLFQEHGVEVIFKNMSKGLPTLGYRLFLQITGRSNPQISVLNSKIFQIHQATIKSRPDACLTLLWIVSQSMVNNLNNSFYLWQEIFFPLLTLKNYTKYCLQILERLVNLSSTNKLKFLIPDSTYFSIMDLEFSIHNQLSIVDRQKLTTIYAQMKKNNLEIANCDNKLNNTFKQYFTRLNGTSSTALTREVLEGLVDCLARDSSCFDSWIKLHTIHLLNSTFLLEFLAQDEKSFSKLHWNASKRMSSLLKELTSVTKSAMPVKNGSRCLSILEILCTKMSGRRFPWKFVLLVLVTLAAAAVTYDVRASGSFKRSWTGRTLQETGAIALWRESLARVTVLSNLAVNWAQTNLPIYYANLNKNVGPYFEVARDFVLSWVALLWESLLPVRRWYTKTVPPICDHVLEKHVPIAVKLINDSILSVRRLFVEAGLWIQSNVLTGSLAPENIMKVISVFVSKAQIMSSDAYLWISKQVFALKN